MHTQKVTSSQIKIIELKAIGAAKDYLHHCILYEFQWGKNIKFRNFLKTFGECGVSDRTCRRQLEKFRIGDFDFSDFFGWPPLIYNNRQLQLNKWFLTRFKKNKINLKIYKIGDYELSEKNLNDLVINCTSYVNGRNVPPSILNRSWILVRACCEYGRTFENQYIFNWRNLAKSYIWRGISNWIILI